VEEQILVDLESLDTIHTTLRSQLRHGLPLTALDDMPRRRK
jgi:hypothetical protein